MSSFIPCSRAGRLARAAACLFLLSSAGLTAAQSQLDPIVVTGTREPQALSRAAADVVVISAATVRDSTADSVEDLLRRETGLQLTRTGGPGQSSGYFIRGASTSGTVVLIDGVRVGSASLGQTAFESISLAQVDHIEVLRGPASSLYGADGVGGVIQIFTRRGEGAPRVAGSAAVGGYGSREADLGVSGSQSGFDYAASIGRERSRGVSAVRPGDAFGLYNPDDDGYARTAGNLRLGWTPAAGHRIGVAVVASKVDAQYDGADYLAPDFAADPSADFRTRLRTSLVSADYRGTISALWTASLQASKQVDDSTSGGATSTRFKTRREQATWQNALHFGPDQQMLLAYEALHESVSGDAFTGAADEEPSRRNHGFVAGYTGRFGGAGIEASLRHDRNSVYGNNTTGNVGASYQVTPELKLRALTGTTFRAPTFNDLYYPGYGVDTVRAERGRSFEIGAAWRSGDSGATATLYRNRVRQLIAYDPDPDGIRCPAGYFGCAANVARARLQGATLGASQRWGGLEINASIDFLDARDADTGERLPRRAAHQESVALSYTRQAWTFGASLLDVGARPDGGAALGGYATVDLRAAWRFQPQWRVEAKLLNALDHRVEPVRDYQGLGRQAWLGLRFDGQGL